MARLPFALIVTSVLCVFVWSAIGVRAQGIGNTAQTKDNLDLPYDSIGENTDEEDAPEIVQFYGQSYEGDGVFYCIDRSSSMLSSGELSIAKREVVRNISEFSPRVQFGIVFFDSGVIKYPPSGQPQEASGGNKQGAISWVQGMAGGSGSSILSGMTQALRFTQQCSSKRITLIYVGDGGGSSPEQLGILKAQNTKNAQINTIGVLDVAPSNRQFLQTLAQMNRGTYTEITR